MSVAEAMAQEGLAPMQDAPYISIPLYDRQGDIWGHALVDHADADLATHRWCRTGGGYLMRRTYGSSPQWIYLHRAVLGLSPGDGMLADHINRDTLDNRRTNLRIVTSRENGHNRSPTGGSSGYRGVSWARKSRKWRAACKLNGRTIVVGMYEDEIAAARAARAFRLEHMSHTVEEDI